jgi:hypothetical protein
LEANEQVVWPSGPRRQFKGGLFEDQIAQKKLKEISKYGEREINISAHTR